MASKKRKPAPVALKDSRTLAPELQARMERLVESLGYLILLKVNPEAARMMKAGC